MADSMNAIIDETEETLFKSAKFLVKFEFKTNSIAYLWDKGVNILHYFKQSASFYDKSQEIAFSWQNFQINSYYTYGAEETEYYEFILNATGKDKRYESKSWSEMLKIIFEKCNPNAKYRSHIKTLLNQYIIENNIKEIKIAEFYGYDPILGWVLPDKYKMNTGGSDIRKEIAINMEKNLINVNYKPKEVKRLVKEIYDLTGIQYKDYFFAYMCIAPFLFAFKSIIRIAPPIALGGHSQKGKTPMCELISTKAWGHVDVGGIDESYKSEAQLTHFMSSCALPFVLDDCEDFDSKLISLVKRSTTQRNKSRRLNANQSTRMNMEVVGIFLFTYNKFPSLFKSHAIRQRIVNYNVEFNKKDKRWIKCFNKIPPGMIGWYIIQRTKNLPFPKIVELYNSMSDMGNESDRISDIIKLYQLGKHFMKEWFDIELDISLIPKLIRETICTSDEFLISILLTLIEEGSNFDVDKRGVLSNPNLQSWVKHPVMYKEYTASKGKNQGIKQKGYLLHSENIVDLGNFIHEKINMTDIDTILRDGMQWKDVVYTHFYKNKSTVRALFIPMKYINGEWEDEQYAKQLDETGELDKIMTGEIINE